MGSIVASFPNDYVCIIYQQHDTLLVNSNLYVPFLCHLPMGDKEYRNTEVFDSVSPRFVRTFNYNCKQVAVKFYFNVIK